MQQCKVMESLYNVHDIISLFCYFDFDLLFFFGKHILFVLLKEVIIHATLSYLLQISLVNYLSFGSSFATLSLICPFCNQSILFLSFKFPA